MVHISKHPIKRDVAKHIDTQLVGFLTTRFSRNTSGALLSEILTSSEKIMLAKRLAILVMLIQKCSTYEIAQTLQVSTSTIKHMHIQLEENSYQTLQNILTKKKEREELLKFIETILRAGLPPRGRGRWSRTLKYLGG